MWPYQTPSIDRNEKHSGRSTSPWPSGPRRRATAARNRRRIIFHFFFSLSSARRRVHWLGDDRPESRIKFFKLYFVKCRAGVASRNWRFLILSCPLSIHPLEIVHPTPTWVTFNKNYRCVGARPKKSLFFYKMRATFSKFSKWRNGSDVDPEKEKKNQRVCAEKYLKILTSRCFNEIQFKKD